MASNSNKKYWDSWNIKYSQVWETAARKEMSKKETSFIVSRLKGKNSQKILDIGVGNGRILDVLAKKSNKKSAIFGIDISDKMVKICKKRFQKENKVKDIVVCDLSQKNIPFQTKFDFITMIRVLKYNPNWQKMIKKVFNSMNSRGRFIFTMPNNRSISILSGDKFSDRNTSIIYSNPAELKKILVSIGFSNIEIIAFSKLPNFLYHISNNSSYVKVLLIAESVLESIFGRTFMGRELFVCCNRS